MQKKGVGIESNFNLGGLMLGVFVILASVVGIIGITKGLQQLQETRN